MQIIVADNQVIFRTGILRVLAMEPSMTVAAQCSDLTRLKEAVGSFRRSIVIFPSSIAADLHDLLNWIDTANSQAILILEHEAVLADSVAQRVHGLVHRSVAGPQLVECIHRVAEGERSVQGATIREMPQPDRVGAKIIERLTPKELQIVALVADGCKNKEIAERLFTKEQVIKNYLRSIYDKVGVNDRLELALFTVHHKALADATDRIRGNIAKSA